MEDFIRVCGSRKWVASTYTVNIGLYRNYILPVLGSCSIQNLYSKDVDIYIRMLTKTISAASNVKEEPLYISALKCRPMSPWCRGGELVSCIMWKSRTGENETCHIAAPMFADGYAKNVAWYRIMSQDAEVKMCYHVRCKAGQKLSSPVVKLSFNVVPVHEKSKIFAFAYCFFSSLLL